jgi:hypothetical protein
MTYQAALLWVRVQVHAADERDIHVSKKRALLERVFEQQRQAHGTYDENGSHQDGAV